MKITIIADIKSSEKVKGAGKNKAAAIYDFFRFPLKSGQDISEKQNNWF